MKASNLKQFRNGYIITIILLLLIPSITIADDQIIKLDKGKQIILHDDFTWEYVIPTERQIDLSSIKDNAIPQYLRQGIQADKDTIILAIKLYQHGWRYDMPKPKSAQAAWGNSDGRTTWWYGYWYNVNNANLSSQTQPIEKLNGLFYGDNQDRRNYWRNGGSPPFPTKIEWLLSTDGGIAPR